MQRSSKWLEHALRRSRWQPQQQVVGLATLGFFIALLLGALYLMQVASEATTNRQLEELVDQRDDLERINEQIRAEIAVSTSVENLQARAEAQGFALANDSQILYLVVDGYQPIQVDTVAPVAASSGTEDDENANVYDETFSDWLGRQWDAFTNWVEG